MILKKVGELLWALLAAAVLVGGQLLAGKIASNRANDPKAAIGTGTAPALQPGGDT
jgi:hypothetical protein